MIGKRSVQSIAVIALLALLNAGCAIRSAVTGNSVVTDPYDIEGGEHYKTSNPLNHADEKTKAFYEDELPDILGANAGYLAFGDSKVFNYGGSKVIVKPNMTSEGNMLFQNGYQVQFIGCDGTVLANFTYVPGRDPSYTGNISPSYLTGILKHALQGNQPGDLSSFVDVETPVVSAISK